MRIPLEVCMKNNIFGYLGIEGISSKSFRGSLCKRLDHMMSPSEMGLIYCSWLFWQTWNAEISYAFNKVKKKKRFPLLFSCHFFFHFGAYAMQLFILCVYGKLVAYSLNREPSLLPQWEKFLNMNEMNMNFIVREMLVLVICCCYRSHLLYVRKRPKKTYSGCTEYLHLWFFFFYSTMYMDQDTT